MAYRRDGDYVSIQQILPLATPYLIDSAKFDGTTNYLTRGAGLTGISNGKQFTFGCWFRLDGGNAAEMPFLAGARALASGTTDFEIYRDTANKISVAANNGALTQTILVGSTSSTFTSGATWHELLMSVDMANSAGSLIYVDDADAGFTGTSFVNDVLRFTNADWSIGALADGTLKFNGALVDLWFNTSWIDLTVTANRRKFRNSVGKPIPLGTTGQFPTGSSPFVFDHLTKGANASNFGTNLGTGGGWTIHGTLATGSSTP